MRFGPQRSRRSVGPGIPGNALNAPNTPDQKTSEASKPRKPERTRKGRLPKQSLADARLRKHADYQRAYAAARKRQSASMSWFLAPRPEEASNGGGEDHAFLTGRVGLTAGKVLGKAHERNRIKRRMREVLRRHLDLLPGGADLILHSCHGNERGRAQRGLSRFPHPYSLLPTPCLSHRYPLVLNRDTAR